MLLAGAELYVCLGNAMLTRPATVIDGLTRQRPRSPARCPPGVALVDSVCLTISP